MSAEVHHAEFADVQRLGQSTGGHIGDEHLVAYRRQLLIYRAVNGVVHTNIHIVRIVPEIGGCGLGNIAKGFVRRGGHGLHIAVLLSLLIGFLGPLAGDDIVRLAAAVHKVQRNGRELGGSAALQKEHLVVVRHPVQLPHQCLGVFDDLVKGLGAVAHLHNGLAAAPVVHHLYGCSPFCQAKPLIFVKKADRLTNY